MTARTPSGPRADDPSRLTATYRVRFDEARPDGTVRGSAVLGYVQDAAWQHSEALGFGRVWYAERGLLWLVRAVDLTIVAAVPYGVTLDATTEVIGFRRVMARRESRLTDEAGALLAVARTDWVLTDERGAPTRIPDVFARFLADGSAAFEPLRVDRGDPPDGAPALELTVRGRDLDPVGHANNGFYLDILEESVAHAGGVDPIRAVPRRYVLEYAAPATGGDVLRGRSWPISNGWGHRLERDDGLVLARGSVRVGDAALE